MTASFIVLACIFSCLLFIRWRCGLCLGDINLISSLFFASSSSTLCSSLSTSSSSSSLCPSFSSSFHHAAVAFPFLIVQSCCGVFSFVSSPNSPICSPISVSVFLSCSIFCVVVKMSDDLPQIATKANSTDFDSWMCPQWQKKSPQGSSGGESPEIMEIQYGRHPASGKMRKL